MQPLCEKHNPARGRSFNYGGYKPAWKRRIGWKKQNVRPKSKYYYGGPDLMQLNRDQAQLPTVPNLKGQYFVIQIRSKTTKVWYPLNVIDGKDAAQFLKNVEESDIAKAVGADKLAKSQEVKAIGGSLYSQKAEIFDQAKKMYSALKYTKDEDFQFGYKEVADNEKFNDDPMMDMSARGVSVIPPEEDLRDIRDDIGDAASAAQTGISKISDNVKDAFSKNFGDGR